MTSWRDMRRRATSAVAAIGCSLTVLALAGSASAKVPGGGCNLPVSERTSEIGCYLTTSEELGELPQAPLFWHLYNYPTRAAAEAIKGPRMTVVESFGKVWLYTIADAGWQPTSGDRIAVVGPLPIKPGRRCTARYMEAVFAPGMRTSVHRHSGLEAWYVLAGAQCLETPDGIISAKAGEAAVVPEGPPMVLSSVGTETRRSVLFVLHDASQPWVTPAHDWQLNGACPQ